MWDFLMAFFIGGGIGSTRVAQRVVKPVLALFVIGLLFCGFIYVFHMYHLAQKENGGSACPCAPCPLIHPSLRKQFC